MLIQKNFIDILGKNILIFLHQHIKNCFLQFIIPIMLCFKCLISKINNNFQFFLQI
jgi:hypothetical protein